MGVIVSCFSTLVSQFAAARIGRDAVVDWMVVAAIPLRDGALQVEPGWGILLGGILFHQWADFSWAVIFFGVLQRWTGRLGPWGLALVAAPWAILTSATEWLVLVPLLPFWQPVFPLNQPYWIGALVHLTSASLYPLFPFLRDWMANRPSPHRRFAMAWAGGAAGMVGVLGLLAALGAAGHEWPPHPGRDGGFDQAWMRRMAAHHAQGVALGRIAVERAQDPGLRAIARLITASQAGERAILAQWWRGWFGGDLPEPTLAEHAAMPGMLPPEDLPALAKTPAEAFDARFVALMSFHHQGAIAMADDAIHAGEALRLRLMAHAIRHSQRGEIALMHGTQGFAATRAAVANMLLPAGAVPEDGALGAGAPPLVAGGGFSPG
jgi:uncharacterized protein (DUF305 family)